MKLQKLITAILLSLGIMFGTSCIIIKPTAVHDKGHHKGWYKNKKNPHNPDYKGNKNKNKENKKNKK